MFPFRTQSFIPTYWVCFLEHKIFFTRFTIFFKSYDSKRMGPFHSGWALVWTRIFYSLWTLEALWYIHITQNFMQNWNMALDLHYLVVKASKSIISRKNPSKSTISTRSNKNSANDAGNWTRAYQMRDRCSCLCSTEITCIVIQK